MSRFRLSSILAAAGILIVTGGCAGSPTGLEAVDAQMVHAAAPPLPEPVPATAAPAAPAEDEEMTSLSSGYIGTGSRQDDTVAP